MELIVLLVEAWLCSFWELEEGNEYKEGCCSDESFKIRSAGISITAETGTGLILGGVLFGSGKQFTICGLDLIVVLPSLTLT